ncbi:MAG TPA: poly-gamma-glutamate synthase PgsB [Bacteroidales bacterium]|nr:poly-gamma-glutamate synthase PgsB [Bacteroidales bacterium]
MGLFIISTAFLLIFLLAENFIHSGRLRKIPLRISVSGTRGKTTIVRLLASVFRKNGMVVLAKTTGSEAKYILPDGSEKPVRRWGITTIMEQKRLIKLALKLKADCIITEIMSINPENHYIETQKLIRPGITILSNFRPDHTSKIYLSPEEASASFLNDIFPSSKMFIHENELNGDLENAVYRKGSELIRVTDGFFDGAGLPEGVLNYRFSENLDLVSSVSRFHGIGYNRILEGITEAKLDIGNFEINRFSREGKETCFVNSFAANDPLSTSILIRKALTITGKDDSFVYGIISLRNDRGERSKQWLDFLSSANSCHFRKVFVSGRHAKIFQRNLCSCEILKNRDPGYITSYIIDHTENGAVIFGLANISGLGSELVNYWNQAGMKI